MSFRKALRRGLVTPLSSALATSQTFGKLLLVGLLLLTAAEGRAQSRLLAELPKLGEVKTSAVFPERNLRGFGRVKGESLSVSAGGQERLQVLRIEAESEGQASILQAKYASDLQSLGNVEKVSLSVAGGEIPCFRISSQGYTISAKNGKELYLVSAREQKPLIELFAAAGASQLSFASEASVPMFLDGWDQYAFRFYYRPGALPKDKGKRKDYNPLTEFDYAKKMGDLGFVFWANENQLDFAGGLTHNLLWDWAARAAERRHLPMVINTSTGAASWLLNQYRDQTMMKMPQFCGSFHKIADPYHGGMGKISWASGEAKDTELALLQTIVKEYSQKETTIDYLEPHGELDHGEYNIFLEYGPEADKSYRQFLKDKYGSVNTLNQRWFGRRQTLTDWNEVRIPEVASFLGWNDQARDLTGTWRIAHFKGKPEAAWLAADFNDQVWPEVEAPGHDRTMFFKKEPAVYRRSISVDESWLKAHPKVWLYVWDLNYGKHKKEKVTAYVNGQKAGDDLTLHAVPHWGAYRVDQFLKTGQNQVSLILPQGYLAYRVYLSPDEPVQYPNLGTERNAQWVDFTDWRTHTRVNSLKRGIEMIRQVDPDRSIVCMAPDGYVSEIKSLCEDYGARFHNTGSMSGWWNDYLPSLMRSSGLPFSLEPGGPAKDLPAFKRMMGHYFTQGVNAIHYFIHIGSIMWHDQIRGHFEKIVPMLQTLGRIHQPQAQIAFLHSSRVGKLTGYPWGRDPNTNLDSGYVPWRLSNNFTSEFLIDAVTESDFARGNATPYQLIYDSNTAVMDNQTVDDIEKWVRNGGTFVTFVQTGRHTPEEKDAWPISRLTGYEVTGISAYKEDGSPENHWKADYAPGQTVFDPAKLRISRANGLKLKRTDPAARNLILWEDGSVAAGVRKLGKGQVVSLGLKFCNDRIWWGGLNQSIELFRQLFQWAHCQPIPATVDAPKVMLKQYVSNNGLYDVWVLWNQDKKQSAACSLTFRDSRQPAFFRDVETGKTTPLNSSVIKGIAIPPLETRMFLTPRNRLAAGANDWFTLQRDWWKGTKAPERASLPELKTPNTLDLTEQWRYQELDDKPLASGTPLAQKAFDDSSWGTRRLSCWAYPEELKSRHVIFRKELTVPANWNNGTIFLWIRKWMSSTVNGRMRVWLDGKELKGLHPPRNGIDAMPLNEMVTPGSTYLLAVEVEGDEVLPGLQGSSFLSYIPNPRKTLDLAGMWQPSQDALTYQKPVKLPGPWHAFMAKRTVRIDENQRQNDVYLHMETSSQIIGVLVNGHWLRRHHHRIGGITHLNITPWIEFGAENEVEIVSWGGASRGTVDNLALYFYGRD
jgi:hypothetical protein